MQAYKVKGAIDESGNLIINEPIKMAPGEVEVIVLQAVPAKKSFTSPEAESPGELAKKGIKPGVKSLRELLENAPPIPTDFAPEQAKWEYLKEKHNL